jgi:flagellar basal-body rod protein FlgF
MVRGIYTAVSGSLAAQAAVDTIANNLANVNTNGFKRSLLQVQAQPQIPIERVQTDHLGNQPIPTRQIIGTLGSGAEIHDTPTIFEQGLLATTGNDFDIALSGPGFLTVQTSTGATAYTRNGSLARNAQGYLVTQSGDLVLDTTRQPISLPEGKITVAPDGTLSSGTATLAKLGVVEFQNLQAIRPQGSSHFIDSGNGRPQNATATTTVQGALEKSNTDVVHSMVDLINNQRWFEANQKVIQTEDTTTGLAISAVGRSSST